MLQLTPHHTILLAIHPVDFRKGIEGLAAICRLRLLEDPFSGKIFVFTNKPRTSVKILIYDGQGFWLVMKRFSQGKLLWWPAPKESTALSPSDPMTTPKETSLRHEQFPVSPKVADSLDGSNDTPSFSPPSGSSSKAPSQSPSKGTSYEVLASQLHVLLYKGSIQGANIPSDWRQLKRSP